jgi:hypothetical protein
MKTEECPLDQIQAVRYYKAKGLNSKRVIGGIIGGLKRTFVGLLGELEHNSSQGGYSNNRSNPSSYAAVVVLGAIGAAVGVAITAESQSEHVFQCR